MKKLFVIFCIIFTLSIGGCGWSGWDNTIHNESDFNVTFTVRKASTYTVLSGKTFIGARNDLGVVVDQYESCTPKRVAFVEINQREGKFVNLKPIDLKVYNTLSIDVTLSADGYLYHEFMNIDASWKDDAPSNKIFSKKPVFKVSTQSFPAIADFQIVDNTMYVIIR